MNATTTGTHGPTPGPDFFLNTQLKSPRQHRGASASTDNSTTLAPGNMNAMDILHSAASMELLAEQARQAAKTQNTSGVGGWDQVQQQGGLSNASQLGAATNLYQRSNLQGYRQAQYLSNNQLHPYLKTKDAVPMRNMQHGVHKDPPDTTVNAKGVARSVLLSNMWVYFRSRDYEGISSGYKAVSASIVAPRIACDF